MLSLGVVLSLLGSGSGLSSAGVSSSLFPDVGVVALSSLLSPPLLSSLALTFSSELSFSNSLLTTGADTSGDSLSSLVSQSFAVDSNDPTDPSSSLEQLSPHLARWIDTIASGVYLCCCCCYYLHHHYLYY